MCIKIKIFVQGVWEKALSETVTQEQLCSTVQHTYRYSLVKSEDN